MLAWRLLERQGNQVAKSTIGQHVLIREKAVIRHQLHPGMKGRSLCRDQCSQPPRQSCWRGCSEKNPTVCALTGAGPFNGHIHAQRSRRITIGGDIGFPSISIEIRREENAGVVLSDRIRSNRLPAREMSQNSFFIKGRKSLIEALRAFYPRLFANSARPFIEANRRVSFLSRS